MRFTITVLSVLFVTLLAFSLAGCDQLGGRYELSKDSKGRTIRLDKRTGEMVIVDGDKIVSLKEASEVDRKEKEETTKVGEFKYWPPLQLDNFSTQVKAT